MTVFEAVANSTHRLRAAGIDSAARDARALVAYALGVGPDRIVLLGPDPIDTRAQDQLSDYVERRLQHEPVSKIAGLRQFWGRDFHISKAVLDPRPETETVIVEALKYPAKTVLDLGTGSGVLAVTLMMEWPKAEALATDISPAALAVARENADRFDIGDRLNFAQSNWFEGVQGSFDLIVANPPYIAMDEMAGLDRDVRDYDPHIALSPGGDGLDPYRVIAACVRRHLSPDGRLIVEIGYQQAVEVMQLFQNAGLSALRCHADLAGRDRVISARIQ
ncbi:MAG: peptide chain release factor N(5)-glutamine methyltransferase [Rhodobacteraceae bacterium]|nr:peptide chain release factor N(5)-glutamine methyltransferase [Paracoccaceae bacterium]